MKFKYLMMITTTTFLFHQKTQAMSIFLKATKSQWYKEFLHPVADELCQLPNGSEILDIGTGPGNLPAIVASRKNKLKITGIDIDSSMIREARKRYDLPNLSFDYQEVNAPLSFENQQFDALCFCSVLFLLDQDTKQNLVLEAARILKPKGKIFILTPSGKRPISKAFWDIRFFDKPFQNLTFSFWKLATTRAGRNWQNAHWAENFALENGFSYTMDIVFHGHATLEILTKN
jgi:ubiquinone/menaquinone biosynthesis C-methylase UbiE